MNISFMSVACQAYKPNAPLSAQVHKPLTVAHSICVWKLSLAPQISDPNVVWSQSFSF